MRPFLSSSEGSSGKNLGVGGVTGSNIFESSMPAQQTPPHQPPSQPSSSTHNLLSQQHQMQQQSRSVKRPRPVKSCTECRKRKLRCDRMLPCSQCQKSNRNCRYSADHESSLLSDGSDTEPVEANRPLKRTCPPGASSAAVTVTSESAQTPAKNGESPSLPVLEELTLRMDRLEKHMRSRSPAGTESSANKPMAPAQDTVRGLSVKRGATSTRFFGQHSSRVMLNVFDEAKSFMKAQRQRSPGSDLFLSFGAVHRVLQDNLQVAMKPITVFVDSMMPVQKRMTDILPKKDVCDRLVKTYFDTSETIYRILHNQTFYDAYNMYWDGKLQSDSFLPQLLSVLSVASRFETKSKGMGPERAEGVHIPTACALVRSWLDSLKGKQLIDISTIQVEILLIHARRMITPRLQDSWTKLGYVLRLAMNMGMHLDPSENNRIPVFWAEMRRRLWFTMVDMDLHMSLACNMPSMVREGDFTCQPPRNLNDSELYPSMRELPPGRPIDEVTDNQMQIYGAMTLGVRMRVAPLVNRIDYIRDYQEVLDVGAKLERFLDDINYIFPRTGGFSPAQKSKQWRTRVILDMHVRRPLLALYRPLALGGAPDVPAEISRTFLKSSVVILKYLDELDPMLPHLNEIAEMYHQILKPDIIQATLSVSYYVQSAIRQNSEHLVVGQPMLRLPSETTDELSLNIGESMMPWSPQRLINTVAESLQLLIKHMSGSDTKDVLCVAVVLETAKVPEPRAQDMIHNLHGVLEGCLRASNLTRDKVHAIMEQLQSDGYMHGQSSYGYANSTMSGPSSLNDYAGWIMWEGWD